MFLETPRDLGSSRYTVRNSSNGAVVSHSTELALTRAARKRGLLGRDHLADGHGMLIAPCSSIHTFFMRFPIDVIFVKRSGEVVKIAASVPAWRLAFGWGAAGVVELPAGTAARAGVAVGNRLELHKNAL